VKRHALAIVLALAIALHPTPARAGALDDFAEALLVAVLVVAAAGVAVETVSGVAAYKNFQTRAKEEDPSPGWVLTGVVSGFANLGVGTAFIVSGLPETQTLTCPIPDHGVYPPRFSPTDAPGTCAYREPASVGAIAVGSAMIGFGVLLLGSSVAALSSKGTGNAASGGPGSMPAMTALSVPVLTFLWGLGHSYCSSARSHGAVHRRSHRAPRRSATPKPSARFKGLGPPTGTPRASTSLARATAVSSMRVVIWARMGSLSPRIDRRSERARSRRWSGAARWATERAVTCSRINHRIRWRSTIARAAWDTTMVASKPRIFDRRASPQ
jgi:hypothetical protein